MLPRKALLQMMVWSEFGFSCDARAASSKGSSISVIIFQSGTSQPRIWWLGLGTVTDGKDLDRMQAAVATTSAQQCFVICEECRCGSAFFGSICFNFEISSNLFAQVKIGFSLPRVVCVYGSIGSCEVEN